VCLFIDRVFIFSFGWVSCYEKHGLDQEKNQCIREKNGSREYSKGNKTVPGKVATTRTEDGHKQDT
jgi:hypothetical protein